ncbi:hypothetical protein CPB86DRAFT_791320, partial [Serendipita vermifera]
GIEEANVYSHDHFHAWLHGLNGHFLFVDLTPGQIASKFGYKDTSIGNWTYKCVGTKSLILNEEQQQDVEGWTAQDIYNKLVKPLLSPPKKKLDLVGILIPEGIVSNLSSSEIEKELSGVPVRWVHLNDLSYGAVVSMNEKAFYGLDGEDEILYTQIPAAHLFDFEATPQKIMGCR